MPALLAIASPLVLISGANGYIAMHIIRGLLESSYCVRGTVRSESMIAHLQKTFEAFGHKLDIVVVANITRVILVTSHLCICVEVSVPDDRTARLMEL
jgi:nucleoside-diphosphate-sugar epimerase